MRTASSQQVPPQGCWIYSDVIRGEELDSLREPLSKDATPLNRDESVEVVWGPYKNAPRPVTAKAVSGTFDWKETLGQTQYLLEWLYLTVGFGKPEGKWINDEISLHTVINGDFSLFWKGNYFRLEYYNVMETPFIGHPRALLMIFTWTDNGISLKTAEIPSKSSWADKQWLHATAACKLHQAAFPTHFISCLKAQESSCGLNMLNMNEVSVGADPHSGIEVTMAH